MASRVTEQNAHAHLLFRLPLDPARLLRARQRIRDYLYQRCVSTERADEIVLAIEEAMTNAVRHSGASADLEIRLRFDGRDLHADVEDWGRGLDLTTVDLRRLPDPLSPGGRGLFLIARLMDDVQLRSNRGLEVRMVKRAVLATCASDSPLEIGIAEGQLLEGSGYRQQRLRNIVEEIGEAYAAIDWEYRFTYVNGVALELYALPLREVIGRSIWELFPHIEHASLGHAVRDCLELGRPAIVEFDSLATGRWIECRVYPTGSGASLYLRDIDDRKRKERERDEYLESQRRMRAELTATLEEREALLAQVTEARSMERTRRRRIEALHQVTEVAVSSLDVGRVSQRMLDYLVEHHGFELAAVWLADRDELQLTAAHGYPEQYEELYSPMPLSSPYDATRVYRSGLPVIVPDIGSAHPAVVEMYGTIEVPLGAYVILPLRSRGRTIGTLHFGWSTPRRIDAQDVDFYASLGTELGTVIENARLFTEQRERARYAETLTEIDGRLRSSLDRRQMMRSAVADGARALGADSAAITLPRDGAFVVEHAYGFKDDPTGVVLSEELERHSLEALTSRELVLVEDAATGERVDSEHLRSFGIEAVIVVPLIVSGEAAADLFFNFGRPRRFSAAEVEFARRLGASLSLALQNARLYEVQQRIATTLQEHLIHPLPEVDGLELAVHSLPAFQPELVGGDFSDCFVLPDGQVVVVIGDVAGKGIEAAGLTETVRSTIRAFATVDTSPAFILRKTNELLSRYEPHQSHVTALLCVIDPLNGHLSAASAGHPAPVHVSPFTCSLLCVSFGPPLGALEHADYTATHLTLTLDDCLVLYTDGVTEARRGLEFFGEAGLLRTVEGVRGRPAAEVAKAIGDAALAFGGELRDDLHVVVVRLA